ncbi:DNA glycosylase [Xylaria digitata]|nr:DNA glycosylase [Xylaria digitata]
MFFILPNSSQPLSFLRSPLSRHIFTTTTILCFHPGKSSLRTIQTLNRPHSVTVRRISREYQNGPLELRGVSFQPRRDITASQSYSVNLRGFTTHSAIGEASKSQLVATMSTRRSARLAASESKATIAPPPPSPLVQRGRKRRAGIDAEPNGVTKEAPAKKPKTSNKKRAQRTTTPPPPTPTPSNVKRMAEPAAPGIATYATPPSKKPRAAAVDRLADSDITLATLLSPETSRVVTSRKVRARSPETSPTRAPVRDVSAPKVSETANVLEEGNKFLISVDPRMRPLVENNHCRIFSPEGLAERVDPFEALCSGIISQQVSGAAAKSIKRRFVDLFYEDEESRSGDEEDDEDVRKRPFPVPSQVVDVPLEKLRTAGLSQRKAEYVSGLAEKFVAGELSAQILANAPYEEVITRLTAVRGLGLWSAEMFACFGLKRIDVFSLGDLGVQRGMAAFVGRDIAKLKSKGGKFKYMSEADMRDLSDQFKPYRSLFMWYMWRVEETDISTME